MRAPIRFNSSFWPGFFCHFAPSTDDPRILFREKVGTLEFTRAVSTFKFGTTFKTTQKARFPQTILALAKLDFSSAPVVLDVGASDGSTSLDMLDNLKVAKYYVTDLNIEVFYRRERNKVYFYDSHQACILIVTDQWVIYADTDGAIPPFELIARRLFKNVPVAGSDAGRILLIHPALQARVGEKVVIKRHDIFATWPFEKAGLVLAANILNRSYFSDAQIARALGNLYAALSKNGILAIVDSRDLEKATLFRKTSQELQVIAQINGGTEIEALAKSAFLLSKQV
jgi:hypothetical protein